ncbi:meiotically up-regulated gene 184 protein-like [Glycine soja]|uniref:meiotically up-regulated gene 184 protein-like n=1 Tax=Glycine soja TaxID=3848 RepID=UPI00054A626F|nr:meiotically up-regulated gene 184 protein-like [Glycine soja]KHN20189.1 DnaJ like subfamily B member 12 [Glycine soja]
MECNKDEALRARQIAEARMQRGEFAEALRFATKAKRLYADVENIAQIITVCEVHIAAQKKLSGCDMDWYAILQIERLADEATVKKQYRRLALLLHPDKNKFAGAEAAFKLIGQANGLLCDQAKRSLFDKKFGASVKGAAPKPKTSHNYSNGNVFAAKHNANATKTQKSSDSHHFSNGNVFAAKCGANATNYQNSYPNSTGFSNQGAQMTFWTSCQHCDAKYQYPIRFVNANLLCQQCKKPFKALANGFGIMGAATVLTSVNIPKEAPMHGPPKPASENTGRKPLGREQAGTFVRSNPTSMKKCAAGVGRRCGGEKSKDGNIPASSDMEPQTSQNFGSKRVRQSAPDSGESFKARNGDDTKAANIRENAVDSSNTRRSSRKKQHVSYIETSEDDDFEIPSKKPRQSGPLNADEAEEQNVPASGESSDNNIPATPGATDQNKEKVSESDIGLGTSKEDKRSPKNSKVPSRPRIFHCPVSDTDFNDFEKDKEEDCFAVNQLWAVYDSTDAMPRFYGLVKKVASPFQLKITWLEPDPDDKGEIDWNDAELPIACGKFRLGGSQQTTDRTMFSHQVRCIKETGRGSYLVCPNKGETWAIFRDWDINWSSNPKNHLKYDFEYVEILSDFSENVGIAVAYMGKVKGFVSLFQRTEKNGVNIFYIEPNELYRFSHRIPSYKMTGYEREGVPRGSFEFDPAALPTHLFEVGDSGNVKM